MYTVTWAQAVKFNQRLAVLRDCILEGVIDFTSAWGSEDLVSRPSMDTPTTKTEIDLSQPQVHLNLTLLIDRIGGENFGWLEDDFLT